MANKIDYYQKLAHRMIEADRDRNKAFIGYENMYHVSANFPEELRNLPWFRKVVSTDPHDAIEGGTRVLTATEPRITVLPLGSDPDQLTEANKRERILSWHLKNANRRRSSSVEADVMRSSLMYSAVAVNVIDLDWQEKNIKSIDGNSKRWKAMRRMGRFLINTFNPKDVHIQRSGQMVERVLLCQRMPAQEVYDTYGKAAKSLKELAENDETIYFYDYWDLDVHATWCTPGETLGESGGTSYVVLPPTRHDLPFLPWVALMGGSTLEDLEADKYHPLLYSVQRSGDWHTHNIVKSLNVSEVIRNAASPRWIETGPNIEGTVINTGGEEMVAKVPANNTLQPAEPPRIDRALTEIDDRLMNKMEKSTISRVLLGGDVPSGTAFETLNLLTQTALGALKPAKTLAEHALAEVCTLMMLWAHYTDSGLEAYGMERRQDMGEIYRVEADEIEPEALYIEVQLTTDQPMDRQQRANTAMMLRQIGYPMLFALEDMGIADPQKAIEQWYYEKFFEHEVNMLMQQDMAAMQANMQGMIAQAQQNAQAKAQAVAQAATAPVPGGEGFNPAMGGQSPAPVNPAQTLRELVNGETKAGRPLATEELTP